MKRVQKSLAEQLSDISIELFGTKKDYTQTKHTKPEEEFHLYHYRPTYENLPGYHSVKTCGITMATLPIDYIIDPSILNAPCDICINRQCPYSMGELNGNTY